MATQEKSVGASRKGLSDAQPEEQRQPEQRQQADGDGSSEEHSRLGQTLGRAGTAVGDSLSGLARRGNGEGEDGSEGGSGAPKAAAAAAVSAVATLAGRRLLERPRRRVAGIPVPGTRARRRDLAKNLARRLPGRG